MRRIALILALLCICTVVGAEYSENWQVELQKKIDNLQAEKDKRLSEIRQLEDMMQQVLGEANVYREMDKKEVEDEVTILDIDLDATATDSVQ